MSAASVSAIPSQSRLTTRPSVSAANTASATTTSVITLRTCSVEVCGLFLLRVSRSALSIYIFGVFYCFLICSCEHCEADCLAFSCIGFS